MVNSGISPILPADIKSVTIEDVVSARYLDQGITKIINIHLRKNRPLYLYAEGRTRHDVPLRNGFAGSNFEIGRSRFAVYGSIFYNYLTNDKTDFENIEKRSGLEKNMSGSSVARKNSLNLDLLMKWVPSENDYFAWKVSNRLSGARKNNSTNGEYVTNSVASQMSSATHMKDDQNGWLGSFYYERTFSDKSNLDVFAYFNHAQACKDERYSEYTDTEQLSSIVALDNIRNQAAFDVDYIGSAHRYGQIEAGNHLLYTHDNVWDRALEPSALSHVSQTSNYSFLSYSNNWRMFMLMTLSDCRACSLRQTAEATATGARRLQRQWLSDCPNRKQPVFPTRLATSSQQPFSWLLSPLPLTRGRRLKATSTCAPCRPTISPLHTTSI